MADRSPPRLLLIEANPATARLVGDCLERHFGGSCVQHCATLSAVKAVDPRRIDLALSGMHLPDGTGLDAFALLTAQRSDLPFVVVTSEARADLAIKAITSGACDYVLKTGDYASAIPMVVEKNLTIWKIKQDNLRLQEQLSQTLEEVRMKNQQLEEAVRMLEAMAGTDPLTGLANRRSFNQALERAFAAASRYNHDLACIMLDLDNFKHYNDTFGHQRGDDVLRAVARVLEANCRRSDVAGRFGGDEFIVLLPETDLATARSVCVRISQQFASAASDLGGGTGNTALAATSMGLACLQHSRPASPEQLIAQADQALYIAKQKSKGGLALYGATEISLTSASTSPAQDSAHCV